MAVYHLFIISCLLYFISLPGLDRLPYFIPHPVHLSVNQRLRSVLCQFSKIALGPVALLRDDVMFLFLPPSLALALYFLLHQNEACG